MMQKTNQYRLMDFNGGFGHHKAYVRIETGILKLKKVFLLEFCFCNSLTLFFPLIVLPKRTRNTDGNTNESDVCICFFFNL